MWPFFTVKLENEVQYLRNKVSWLEEFYRERDAQRAKRPRVATDLPMTRVTDLAGYLGRVHEQLSFAAIAVAPYDSDPEKTKKTELTLRLRDAAEKAAKVQLDLLEIIQQEREEEAARAIEAQERESQWTTDELNRMMSRHVDPIVPNRIRPMDGSDGSSQ